MVCLCALTLRNLKISREAFSLSTCKYRHVNSNLPWRESNFLLKGMGDETLIGLLHVTPKTHVNFADNVRKLSQAIFSHKAMTTDSFEPLLLYDVGPKTTEITTIGHLPSGIAQNPTMCTGH